MAKPTRGEPRLLRQQRPDLRLQRRRSRQAVAQALFADGGTVSVQCLNEFASVARRKLHLSWDDVSGAIAILVGLADRVLPVDLAIHNAGLRVAERYRRSIYDAMIVAAALAARCDTLYSEDMHAGLLVDDRLRIVDPFA